MTYISVDLRRLVIERAGNCCEYCRLSQNDHFFPFELDHIIAQKHDGETEADNLCLSCYLCNGYKGSDIASIDKETGTVTLLFNPRQQKWEEHFRLNGAIIEPLTGEGRITVRLLRLNHSDHIAEREGLILLGRYPCS